MTSAHQITVRGKAGGSGEAGRSRGGDDGARSILARGTDARRQSDSCVCLDDSYETLNKRADAETTTRGCTTHGCTGGDGEHTWRWGVIKRIERGETFGGDSVAINGVLCQDAGEIIVTYCMDTGAGRCWIN